MPEGSETLGPYVVLRRIGAGGMGEVLLARDPRLEREVALKRLPAEVCADPERRQRFVREALAAAKLAHPNITAIHEVGEAEGCHYIAFEYVEGRTLEALLHERRLSLAELIDLALPLADALAYAHERGVIHRDLKAANVMVTPRGHPKLLDFGLAKLEDERGACGRHESTALTREGAIFGTPQAMSPEQALGRAVDPRSDVFSFGSLLYEMASGRPAFGGDTVMEIMDAVIHAEPPDLARLRPDLPAELAAIVARAMRKDPAERYPSIAGLLADLRHFKRKTESGLVPVAQARRRWLPTALAAGALAATGVVWFLVGRGTTPGAGATGGTSGSIAVMGFERIGAPTVDQGGPDFERALASLVTTALAEAGGIDVASSSKVVACLRGAGLATGAPFDPAFATDAARTAGVDVMLVGQVLARNTGLLLTAELVDVASGNALGSLRREVASDEALFALAEGLATDVRERLGLRRAGERRIDLEADLTDSPEAYFKFVAGEMAIHESRFADARRLMTQALEIDPSFAFAYVRLGTANEWEGNPAAAIESYEGALAHADRLPPRWQRLVRIALLYSRGDIEQAYEDVRALIGEGNAMPEAYNALGEILTHSTRHEDPWRAREAFLQALQIDPNFQIVLYHVVFLSIDLDDMTVVEDLLARLRGQGANPEGIAYLELGLELGRRDAAAVAERVESARREREDFEEYFWCLITLGRLEKAHELLESMPADPGSNTMRDKLDSRGTLALWQGRLREAQQLYLEASDSMSLQGEASVAWYSANLTWDTIKAARTALLLGATPGEACDRVEKALAIDPYGLRALFWKTRWLADAGRAADAAREVERMRALRAESTGPVVAYWLALAETELALVQGDLLHARERLAEAESAFPGARSWVQAALVRARVARAAGEAQAEIAAWQAALVAARAPREVENDLVFHALYGLADAEERAGRLTEARAHGAELLRAWDACQEPGVALLEDARRRWR